jgi:hypothetical protein
VQVAREAITEAMMVLALPDRLLALGHDLDARVPAVFGDPLYPPLGRLVADFDSCPPGGMACGAEDWSNLRQRMHYIVHLFRAFAQDASLYSPPFTDGQVARFHAGVVPDGRL